MSSSILQSNLAAVRRWLPRVADAIEAASITSDWQLTTGTDGTATYCRVQPDALEWLGRTSMPMASADALVVNMTPGTGNGVGLGIGTGYEWGAFLSQLSSNQVVFVFDPDAAAVKMALSVCDLGGALEAGRILILTGAAAGDELLALLDANTGVEPPGVIHPLPTIDAARRNALLAEAEGFIRQVVTRRGVGTAEAVAKLNAMQAPAEKERRLVLAIDQGGPMQRPLRGAMHALATRHPEEIRELLIDHHAACSLLARVEAAIQAAPAVVVSDLFRAQLGPCVPPGVAVETWIPVTVPPIFWFGDSLAAQVAGGGSEDRVVCHSVEYQETLKQAGFARVDVVPMAIPAASVAAPAGGISIRSSVALLGDLLTMDADTHGMKLPSHQAVWNAARDLILEDPLAVHSGMAADLFRRAQTRVGVQIVDEPLTEVMLKAIRHVLSVSGVAIGLARLLCGSGIQVKCIGSGWNTPETEGLPLTVVPTPAGADVGELWSGVAILLQYNPGGIVHPLVLHAATADVAIVAPEHPKDRSPGGIATLLSTGMHYVAPSRRNALQAVKDLARDGVKRKALADAARAHVIAKHTWERRFAVV
jgi:hypothetical protein